MSTPSQTSPTNEVDEPSARREAKASCAETFAPAPSITAPAVAAPETASAEGFSDAAMAPTASGSPMATAPTTARETSPPSHRLRLRFIEARSLRGHACVRARSPTAAAARTTGGTGASEPKPTRARTPAAGFGRTAAWSPTAAIGAAALGAALPRH